MRILLAGFVLAAHSWGPREPSLAPQYGCASLTRSARTAFGS